jgi:hypothetical protein
MISDAVTGIEGYLSNKDSEFQSKLNKPLPFNFPNTHQIPSSQPPTIDNPTQKYLENTAVPDKQYITPQGEICTVLSLLDNRSGIKMISVDSKKEADISWSMLNTFFPLSPNSNKRPTPDAAVTNDTNELPPATDPPIWTIHTAKSQFGAKSSPRFARLLIYLHSRGLHEKWPTTVTEKSSWEDILNVLNTHAVPRDLFSSNSIIVDDDQDDEDTII